MNKLLRLVKHVRSMQSVNMALARGGATSALRSIDPHDPASWEFSGFSQNGEDGIVDFLTRYLPRPNRYFVEIGAADGIENNTSWLAVARRYSGLWIEGNKELSAWCSYLFTKLCYGLEFRSMFVSKRNIDEVLSSVRYLDPDVFSLDIDGNDYHIALSLLEANFRPKIFIVEFNSAFGPDQCITIPYAEDFRLAKGRGNDLYYGCSVAGWRKLFAKYEYDFITVDSNGVNAFFVHRAAVDANCVEGLEPREFAENFSQHRNYQTGWEGQFALISDRKFESVG